MYGKVSLIGLAAMLALPAAAQVATTPSPPSTDPARELPYDRGYDKQTPKHDAVDAVEKPVTEQLNTGAAVEASGNRAATETVNATNEAQYEADMAAYRASVQSKAQVAAADEARYETQQRAYADAMAVWREQKRACDRGVMKACKKPTPNPAEFY
ncbi:hypothetical protein ACFB49_11130 [Sphingomonas sp. DBB INV C78]|uniref:hypothetical protein n=1 Tax=Sphingomonas sp. DBB INV C78 TaxID=3349434 RepID=UPI0036D41138